MVGPSSRIARYPAHSIVQSRMRCFSVNFRQGLSRRGVAGVATALTFSILTSQSLSFRAKKVLSAFCITGRCAKSKARQEYSLECHPELVRRRRTREGPYEANEESGTYVGLPDSPAFSRPMLSPGSYLLWLAAATLGNILGRVGIVSVLNYGQVRQE